MKTTGGGPAKFLRASICVQGTSISVAHLEDGYSLALVGDWLVWPKLLL